MPPHMIEIVAILTSLLECGGSPESMIPLSLEMAGCNATRWEHLRRVLVDNDLINISHHYVTLTEKGTKLAKDLQKELDDNKAAKTA